jgi:hypothetical protein
MILKICCQSPGASDACGLKKAVISNVLASDARNPV